MSRPRRISRQARTEAARRQAERRERQDAAPRLLEEVPRLETLRLDIEEARRGETAAEVRYTRRIVVEHAPAMFEIPCSDNGCDGDHDLTRAVLAELRDARREFRGEDPCRGTVGSGYCERVLRYVGVASYTDDG